ncbi:hypothetical protein N0V82_008633 [Gnomoniopsis sp. IMI 355080]|nr:hypothetical protein N0V82_008633 [Gnomoniopsis sp. IMI 355080]
MLGLLKSSSAGVKEAAAMQPPNIDSQPSLHENMASKGTSNRLDSDAIAQAAAANAAAMGRNMSNYQATLASSVQSSPSPTKTSWTSAEKSSLRARKESANYGNLTINGRRTISTNRTNSHSESGSIFQGQYQSVRDRCRRELGVGVVLDTSYADLRHWINDERLVRLPHKGSSWDRVLISALHFADQVNRLGQEIEVFAPDSCAASNLVFGQCLLLLDKLGHENATALDKAFTLFYQTGLEIAPLLRRDSRDGHENIFEASPEIMGHISKTFSEMLTVVADVTMAYYGAIHHMRHVEQESTKMDIYARFGHHIESFHESVRQCAHEMWRFVLERSGDNPDQVLLLQDWLAPQDTVLAQLSSNHVNLASHAEEYTCTWLQAHLNSFFKGDDKCLLIQGKAGSGKTTMANWVVDRLQRPVNRGEISTLSFFFNSSVMSFETPVSMLKNLLFQLLTRRIGDRNVFKAIMEVYAVSATSDPAQKQEEKLWNSLAACLGKAYSGDTETLAIIIDLDELEAQKTRGRQVVERFQKLIGKAAGVRLIVFSSPGEFNHTTNTTTVNMSFENLADDFHTIIRHGLNRQLHFSDRDEAAQEHIVDQLISIADCSALYASLAVRYLKSQKSHPDFDRAVDALVKSPHKVTDVVQKLLKVMNLDSTSKTLLSVLIAAERPLSRKELEVLLQVQPQQGVLSDHHVHLDTIIKSVAPFTIVGEGLVTLRHRAIKDALVAIPDSSPVSLRLKNRHQDLLTRLFICIKKGLRPQDDHEPTMALLDQEMVKNRLSSDRVLEYAVRYWPIHFRKSPGLHKAEGDLSLPKDFLSVFPQSLELVLLEAEAWHHQSLPHEAMEFLTTAYRVRHAAFGVNHACVLQSAMYCAIFYENFLFQPTHAIEWYLKASKIGGTVLGEEAELVITCCTTILRLSQTLVSTTRTTIATYREQTLILLIKAYKHRYGETSEEVLEIYSTLVELYNSIGEKSKAEEILIQIKEITVGHQHESKGQSHQGPNHLNVTLKKKEQSEIETYGGSLFGYSETDSEEMWTILRVEETISFVRKLVLQKNYSRAEEVLLELWLNLDEHCRGSQAVEWHEKKIQVTLKYVEVLHVQNRKEEASALLVSCWNEYSNHTVSTFESIIIQLKEVAVWMQKVEMSSVALTVFQKCYSWYKSSHMEQTAVFKEIQEHIAGTSKEIVRRSSLKSTTSVTESSETVMREVFESSFTSMETSETTEISSTTMELCESLASIYLKEERWTQAASIIKQTLMKSSFASFFSESLSFDRIDIKSHSTHKHINLIMKLSECYIHQKRYDKAEDLYLRLYRVHRKCCGRLDDALVNKYADMYVQFLKKHDMTMQVISFYQELLVEYRSFYGSSHEKTISVLYELGDKCRIHSVTHGYFVEYYVEIVTNLNRGALVCHENAFRALLIVADHYYQSQRFSESLVYFKSIIATFCKFGTKFKHFEDVNIVQQILEKYYKVIDETKVEIDEHVSILKEIRQACVQFFGEECSISISVTLRLAEVCQSSELHQYEAIGYHEHVLKHSKTVSKTVAERSQSTLKSLYVKQITSSSSSKTVSHEVLQRATEMCYTQYLEIRKTQSVTSHATLTQLEELVTLYHKQSKTESAITEMRSLVVECISKVTSSQELIKTAKHVASMHISCGYLSHAQTLVRELRQQLIYNIVSKGCVFDLTHVDLRACFPFVAAFEWSIRSNLNLTIASFMAELLAESMFYGRFSTSIKTKSDMHLVLMHAARMRSMFFRLHRNKDFEVVETKTVDYFMSIEPTVAKGCSKTSIRAFLAVILSRFSSCHQELDEDTMTSSAGHAAVRELRTLMQQRKYKEAVELARCTYLFLEAHKGLDDPSEISLGFQLCLLMAGRNVHVENGDTNGQGLEHQQSLQSHLPQDQSLKTEMMDLSRKILGEVLEICRTHDISLVRCQWTEINELISLLGQVKDFSRLQWLLTTLWQSRDGQSSWGHDVMLALGTRLVQVSFMNAGHNDAKRKMAIRLAEDLAYNVRRVHGARGHGQTLSIMALLASLYTSTAQHYQAHASAEANGDKKRAIDMSRLYFKKAAVVHEDVLKLLLDSEADDASDSSSVASSNHSTVRRGEALDRSPMPRKMSSQGTAEDNHHRRPSITREQEVMAVKTHLRLLKIALQRLGGWAKPAVEYERLTAKAWSQLGAELSKAGMNEEQVCSNGWKLEEYGNGKSEGGSEGAFSQQESWGVKC